MKKYLLSLFMFGISLFSFSQNYDVTTSTQCNTVTGGTEIVNFTMATANAVGNGTLTVYYQGDLDFSTEYLTISGETGPAQGNTPAASGQCATFFDSVSYTINQTDINSWASDGTISFNAVATTAVNNFCYSSNSFCVYMRLVYPRASGFNDIGIASVDTPNVFCAGPQDIWVTVQNYGINQVDTCTINWTWNGTLQTPVNLYQLLDTAQGTNPNARQVMLGTKTITNRDTIMVWTSNPNNGVDTTNANDTILKIVVPSLSGVYTIGGVSPDYSTFSAAISDLNTYGVCGPVIFDVRSATYNEQITINAVTGASSVNTITFKGNMATLTNGTTTTTDRHTLRLDGAKHIIVDSLMIINTGTTYGMGVHLTNAADSNTISNCVIQVPIITSSNFSGLSISGSTATTSGNNGNGNVIIGNSISGGYYGITVMGNTSTNKCFGNSITNNEITDFYYYGTYIYYQDKFSLNSNTLMASTSASTASYGVRLYYVDDFTVNSNNLKRYGSYGMYVYYGNYQGSGTPTSRAQIANNMIGGDVFGGGTEYGIYLTTNGRDIDVVHNSISNVGVSNLRGIYITSGSGHVVKNNTIADFAGSDYALYVSSTAYVTDVDYNNFYVPNSSNLIYLSGAYNTTNYQGAAGHNFNSMNVNPSYVNDTSDLHTCEPALDGTAFPMGITIDIDGESRDTISPDIGADEFLIISGAFLGPDTSICPGDSILIGIPGNGTFLWTPNGETTGTIWVGPGSYQLLASAACGSGSDNITIGTIQTTASFTTMQSFLTYVFTNTSVDANSYYWDFGDGNNSTQVNPYHIYSAAGNYTVTLIAYGDCTNDTTTFIATPNTVGLDEQVFTNSIKVSPNPNNGQFAVSLTLADNESVKMEVIDIAGKVVYTENVSGKEGQNTVNVNLANAKGVYFIKLTSKLGTAVERVVIK